MPFNLTQDEKILYQTVSQPEDKDEDIEWVGGVTTVTNRRLIYERSPFRFRMSFLFRWRLLMSWVRNRGEMKSLLLSRITSVEEAGERETGAFWGALVCFVLVIPGLAAMVIPGILFLIVGALFLRSFFATRISRVEVFAGSRGIEVWCQNERERDELLDAVEGAWLAASQAALPARPRVTLVP